MNITNLVIFGCIIILTPVVALTTGWWFWGFLFVLVSAAVVTLHCSPTARLYGQSGTGAFLYRVGDDNNYRFYALLGCTIASLILGIKYGGGEPIFVSTFRSSASWFIQPIYTERVQKIQNLVTSGVDESNKTIRDKKLLLEQSQNDYIPRSTRLSNESREQYNERANNYMMYGLFTLNNEIESLLSKATPPPAKVAAGWEWDRKDRSWFLWKLFFVFFLMTVLYAPFAFSDEAAELFDGVAEKLREWWQRQGITQTAAESAPVTTPSGFLTRVGEIAGVDIGMEMLYKAIKNFADYLRR